MKTILLALHILSGSSALLTGLVAMFSVKGKQLHLRSGMVYFISMSGVFLTAIPMALLHHNVFLFTIAVFSYYLTFTGFRHTKLKAATQIPAADITVSCITFVTSVFMLFTASYYFQQGNRSFSVILAVFGLLCCLVSTQDLRRYYLFKQGGESRQHWLTGHIVRMLTSYIAASTAFVVINVHFLPEVIVWLAPTVIGSFGLVYTLRYYKRKWNLA